MEKSSSIKRRISMLFVVLMLITIAVILAIGFYNWKKSIDNMIVKFQHEIHAEIEGKVAAFINIPFSMNNTQHHILDQGILNIYNEKQREIYFASIMSAAEEDVYSFSYGTNQGEYYGARRNQDDQIELMRSDKTTGGQSRYYRVREDLTAGEVTVKLGDFDPRIREWYLAAQEQKRPVFSPIYKHFAMNDLALSAVYPLFDEQGLLKGVLGTHFVLSRINDFLQDSITNGQNAPYNEQHTAYIVEKYSGELVANSLGENNFIVNADGTLHRRLLNEIGNPAIFAAYENYRQAADQASYVEDNGGDRIYIKISELNRDGLAWLIITAIPEKFYTGQIGNSMYLAGILWLLAVVGTIFIWTKSIETYLQPIYSLIQTTERFSHGDFFQRATVFRNDEVGKLANAFNHMAQELCLLFASLENKVAERTKQLEDMNRALMQAKESLEKVSQTDFLTNLSNRRYILEKMEEEIKRSDRYGKGFCVVMADIDYFKKINDTYGHDGGDLILKEIACLLRFLARETDCVSRWGGEEFLLLLPETNLEEAVQAAERIRRELEIKKFCHEGSHIQVTMTLGVATYRQGMTVDEIIKHADVAVYQGKQAGRNRVLYEIA